MPGTVHAQGPAVHSAAAHEPPEGTANGGESSDSESSTALHMPCYAPLYKVTCGCGCGAQQLLHRCPLRTEKRKLPDSARPGLEPGPSGERKSI